MIELIVIGAAVSIALAWVGWVFFRGDTVGTARGLQQGEHTVPGASVRAVVKRHLSGGTPVDVELQLWTFGVAKTFRLEPQVARALSQALERAVAELRSES